MDHDHPYKELFAQPELVADLLRLAEMADGLDLDSLDRRNGSYVSEDGEDARMMSSGAYDGTIAISTSTC